jgi:DNA helicase-2/ATP-dependent DNA helicase PcrA
VLIFAGAGSGKTRTLTTRIAYMVRACGVPPDQILAVTFTNKAAEEMKERIRLLIGDDAKKVWAGTFHWFCARLLRAAGSVIDVPPNFTIYDDSDQLSVVKHALSALNIDSEEVKPPAVLNEISNAKNQLLTVSEYKARDKSPLEKATRQVYRVYQEQLRRNGALDFDDLLMMAVQLLDQHPEVLRRYQQRFHFLLVDEYQDINWAQFRLLQLLAGERANLCVVGDDDQSIYGWRGADVGLILAFREHYPHAQIFRLERNYRSTQKILDCANAIIACNPERAEKRLWTENAPGEDVTVYVAVNEEEEAEWVVDTIMRQVAVGEGQWGDFAILYRSNAMSRVFEEALMARAVPYEVVGGMRFFDRAEIKDCIAYLQVLHNPDDSVALRRIINTPTRGIGDTALAIIDRLAMQNEMSLWNALQLALQDEDLPPRTQQAFEAFHNLIVKLQESAATAGLRQITREMIERSGYLAKLQNSNKADDARRAENAEEFVSTAARFANRRGEGAGLMEFLEYLALSADIDKAESLGDKVSLLTLHSAKGLEFPYVFLVGLEENILPHYRSQESENEIAEERRLLYVGMTRAQKRLWLSRAQRRMQFGEVRQNDPSRFLKDLPHEGVAHKGRPARGTGPRLVDVDASMSEKPAARTIDLTDILSRAKSSAPAREKRKPTGPEPKPPADLPDFTVGDRVTHAKFGRGMIVSLTRETDTIKVAVAFPGGGIKHLDLRYAHLEKA